MTVVTQQGGIDPWALGALPLGVALDLALGDPRTWPHPVRAIGWLVARVERALRIALGRLGGGKAGELLAGGVLVILVVGMTVTLVSLACEVLDLFGGPVLLIGRALLIYAALAIRSLGDETLRVADAPDLSTARVELSKIVGRDTANLGAPEIHRACVETVGENTGDAVVGPLFWLALGGPVALWAYKAISTLDSMVGYTDRLHLYLGRAAARLDDLASLIPARLAWLLIALAASLIGERGRAALRVGWRDGRKHPSPNAAWGEAAIAGALGVRLGGPSTYKGAPSFKPYLGEFLEPIDRRTVERAVRIMQVAALIAASAAWAARIALYGG